MPDTQWPPPGHGPGNRESTPRDISSAQPGWNAWSPRDELDEEELRLKIELNKLHKKRLDAASPSGHNPHDHTKQPFFQHAPNLRYDTYGMHQPSGTNLSNEHIRNLNYGFAAPQGMYQNAEQPPHHYYGQPEAARGDHLAGPWTNHAGVRNGYRPSDKPPGQDPGHWYRAHRAGGLGHDPQQYAGLSQQRPPAWPTQSGQAAINYYQEARGHPGHHEASVQPTHEHFAGVYTSPVGIDMSMPFGAFEDARPPAAQNVEIINEKLVGGQALSPLMNPGPPPHGIVHHRLRSEPSSQLPVSRPPDVSSSNDIGLVRAPSVAATNPPAHVAGTETQLHRQQTMPEIHHPIGEVRLEQDLVAQQNLPSLSQETAAVGNLEQGSSSISDPVTRKEDETASETATSTTHFTSDRTSIGGHTRSTSIASTEEILQTPVDKKTIILPLHSDTVDSEPDANPEDAFGEDETCNCGRSRPSQGNCYFCWPCNGTIFCDQCWTQCPPHKSVRGRVAQVVGLPHEKSDPYVARRIFETLQSERDEKEQELLHDRDEDSSWFGTGKDGDTGDYVFRDFGRYSRLVEELSSRRRQTRFPALVSFVGQTGAGKSSLIRLLVETLAPSHSAPEVPVVGSSLHTDIPTSGDVHLYPDLSTFESLHPIFYADCEGLDGGERQPMGVRKPKANTSDARTHSFTQHIRKQHHTSEREIQWATSAETTSREYHVRHLYPRLLFTFSDVIVFVMKNPRVIENVIEQLIDWAAAALETSSNQPVLPHAIIVLNAFDNSSDTALWDVNKSTIDLLEKVSRAVHQNHRLRKFAEFWREKGRQVETVETLLLSYYSSIRVVRVPEKGRPTLIHQQVQRLYDEITEACQKSRDSKHQLRMLLNSDELQPYLQHAFDHFCRNLERPFDFVQASLTFHPIPSDFGGNILKMALDIMNVWQNRLDGPSLIKELSFLIASCIMLDSARRRNLGTSEKVFGGYVHHCNEMLTTFCNLHWPCEYVHPDTSGRCVNVQAGHQSKGHQLENGRVIAVGDYQSDFTAEKFRTFFEYSVAFNLRCLLQRLPENKPNGAYQGEVSKAAELHKNVVLSPFFRHLSGAKQFVNHTACYCCLTCPPENPLPCGHVLCTPCVQAFGTPRGAFIVEMTECPMHHEDTDGQFRVRWPVFIKPSGAGVRILALDGGGIRGIVELTILQHIETHLGANLPIQAFFDLIVGTSAGGIVALGLGANGWTVGKCLTVFKKLCKKAFERKWALALPGLEHLISFSGRALYETSAIEGALQQAFGSQQALFAGAREIMDHEASLLQRTTKVAVTTTTTGGTPALLGNYNRNDTDDDAPYAFPRSEKPQSEIKVFEAARATSAAPTVFKQFEHKPSGQVYLDGAIHLNCPVGAALREQRLIWPENADRTPDVILSIGTGFNTISRKPVSQATTQPRGLFAGVRMLYKTAVDNITTSLNAEKMWREFIEHSNVPEHLKERYIRLNLKLQKDPPRMDEVSQLEEMEKKTRSQLARESERARIKAVADRLLATSFYFALEQEVPSLHLEAEPTTRTVTGHFECRFAPHSQELMAFGDTLRRRGRDAHRQIASAHHPYFVIGERRDGLEKSSQHILEPDVIDKMIREGVFSMPRVKITLSSRRAETEMFFCLGDSPKNICWYPMSGFPRFLVDELDSGPKVQRSSSAHIDKRAQYKLDWEDFERKRNEWTFTAAQHLSMQNPFQHYGSTSYVNPGDASLDFLDSLKDRFEGRAPHLQVPERGTTVRRTLTRAGVVRWLKSSENVAGTAAMGAKGSDSENTRQKQRPDRAAAPDIPYAERAREDDPAELEGPTIHEMDARPMLPRLLIPGASTRFNTADFINDSDAQVRSGSTSAPVELPANSIARPRTPDRDRDRRQLLRDFSPTRVRERMAQRTGLRGVDAEGTTELRNAPFEGVVVMHWLADDKDDQQVTRSAQR